MPDDRFLHRKAGHSERVNLLTDLEYRVWTQYILSADDFGVMRCSAVTIQADNDHLSYRPAKSIDRALEALIKSDLVREFTHQKRRYVYQHDWQKFQKVAYPRTTDNPKPPADALAQCDDATQRLMSVHPGGKEKVPRHTPGRLVDSLEAETERSIEGLFLGALPTWLGDTVSAETQVRLGNLYCDIVARAKNVVYAIEVKRNLITDAAMDQVLRYAAALRVQSPTDLVIPVVVGSKVSTTKEPLEPVVCVEANNAGLCTVVKTHPQASYLTSAFSLINPRAGAPAKWLTANGERLMAIGLEGGLEGTAPPMDVWFNEVWASYPENRRTRSARAQHGFVEQMSRHPDGPFVAWTLFKANLLLNLMSHEWRVKGMAKGMEAYICDGLWLNTYPAQAPAAERLSKSTLKTAAGAAEFLKDGTS
jgi:hypothetical protein